MKALDEISRFNDLPVTFDIDLAHKKMPMREVLDLEAGDIIRTSRSAGENIDILVGGVLVGFGEIVVIENMTGVRITDFRPLE